MPEPLEEAQQVKKTWSPRDVYVMAAICVCLGLVIGYLVGGTKPQAVGAPVAAAGPMSGGGSAKGAQPMPSLEEMKRMADKKAEPLLAQLKNDPQNFELLIKIGNIYKSTHRFDDAVTYYSQAEKIKPKDVALRAEIASDLYYAGQVDKAIAEFESALQLEPKDPRLLFNLGMVRYKGKDDAGGAIEAWQKLLKQNPQLPMDRKLQVEKMIADAKQQGNKTASMK